MDASTRAVLQSAMLALTAVLNEDAPAAPAKAAKAPKDKAAKKAAKARKAAAAHCHDRREVRRETTVLGGLTKAERSALYRSFPAEAKADWEALVMSFKCGEVTLDGEVLSAAKKRQTVARNAVRKASK